MNIKIFTDDDSRENFLKNDSKHIEREEEKC